MGGVSETCSDYFPGLKYGAADREIYQELIRVSDSMRDEEAIPAMLAQIADEKGKREVAELVAKVRQHRAEYMNAFRDRVRVERELRDVQRELKNLEGRE
jgi:hypothetical protein